ncbi:MAG: TonB-dependent receptor [Fimbriimonadaceae bacterium]|nr:TonB-dependent receptor [Chitinophagales bacterium]
MKKLLLSITVLVLITSNTFAQNFTQTIRGQVLDKESQSPIPGVNIIILDSDPLLGTATDFDGYYVIENVAAGRISIQATFIGYEPFTMNNIELTTGKELVLNFQIEEKVTEMQEIIITASDDKVEALNEMATVSSRQFTIEESMRYAGARNDVSRMAQNFAGVRGSNDAVNDIVIRGNSPVGLLWRLEGIDIPNPNHFGDLGSTGGPVSLLNNNVLANSDFLTGAFPAEYGNAISGVFDLKMRNGNYEKHEFLGQIGFNGFEVGAEGPINRENKSSYLVNYRYSTLGVMSAIGIDFGTGTAIPYYQDISMKLNFPTQHAGIFSVFGVGGFSQIDLIASDETDTVDNLYNNDLDIYDRSKIGIIGVSHQYLINNTSYTRLTLSASTIINTDIADSVSTETFDPIPFYRQSFTQNKIAANFYYKKKFNAKHNLQIGFRADAFIIDLVDSVYQKNIDRFVVETDFEGNTFLLQPYVQYQYRFTDKITLNTGLHYQYLTLNGSNSLEPRAGLKYEITDRDVISFGYGLHSMMAPIATYFTTVEIADGNYITPNDSIDFIKAHHFVVGYDRLLSETMHIKVEAYYQHLYDVLIDRDSSSFSVLNIGTFSFGTPDYLINKGTGRNYGMELTAEKFLDKGFYFLATASLYKSEYLASDEIERETAFSGNYVANLLGGKEFNLFINKENPGSKKSIVLDTKFTAAGGQRYTPIDLEESILYHETRYDWDNAFSEQFDDYYRWDVRLAFKINGKHASQEFAIDVQNITNRQNPLFERYDPSEGEINIVNQIGIFPIPQYKITF